MRKITCIICPRGCSMQAQQNGDAFTVSGNACPRGEKYAIAECTNPTRTVTSTVRLINRNDTMVSVKTQDPIAKDKIFDAMACIRNTQVTAPIKIGDVIISDFFGTNLIATKNVG